MSLQTISVLVEDKPGVLTRVAGLFAARGFNIDSLAVGPTADDGLSRMTIVVQVDRKPLEQITKQLNKLINVIKVIDFTDRPHVEREMALIKVTADQKTRGEVMSIVDIFRGNVIDVGPQSYIIEVTGAEEKINALLELLTPLGIKEIVRTGKVAMHRGMQLLGTGNGKEKAA